MTFRHLKTQRGAALVISLILLVALTLLGIASMNTASLDLIMAGNEQLRGRTFDAVETGIEAALASSDANFDTAATVASGLISLGQESYSYTIAPQNGGQPIPAPSNYSTGNGKSAFGVVTFRITVTGKAARNTSATHVQEVNQIVPSGDSVGCVASIGSCTL